MSVRQKKNSTNCGVCNDTASAPKPNLKLVKGGAEQMRELLQKKILDNPITARKAAVIVTSWLDKPAKKSKT